MKAPMAKVNVEQGWKEVDALFRKDFDKEFTTLFGKIETSLNKNMTRLNVSNGNVKPPVDVLHDSIQEGFTNYMKTVFKKKTINAKTL